MQQQPHHRRLLTRRASCHLSSAMRQRDCVQRDESDPLDPSSLSVWRLLLQSTVALSQCVLRHPPAHVNPASHLGVSTAAASVSLPAVSVAAAVEESACL